MSHAILARSRFCALALASATTLMLVALVGQANAETFSAGSTAQLEEAVKSANANCQANTIVLAGGAYLPGKILTLTDTCGAQAIEGPTNTPEALIDGSNEEAEHPEVLSIGEGVTASVKDVVVQHAGSGAAAAIEDLGAFTVEASTLGGNRGPNLIVEPGATATIRNATLSDGTSAGLVNEGTASLFNDTVAFNKFSGLENGGTLNLTNTIVAQNGKPQCIGLAPATNDHNLSSDSSCGAELNGVNPDLGSLFNNGGATELHSLLPGSPAIDAGDSATCLSTDQEGQPRPDVPSTPCDIGADEWSGVAPTINVPSGITTEATGPSGASVSYSSSATSSVARVRSFSCAPKSGSTFPIGETTVNCTATDGHGNVASASFKVTVTSKAPELHLPETITVPAEGASGAKVSYSATATSADFAASELAVSCSPESGSTFPVGETTVNCSATDPSGHKTTGSFKVIVKTPEIEFKEWILKGSLTAHKAATTLFTLPEGSRFNGHATVPGALEGNTSVPAFKSTVRFLGILPVTLGLTFNEAGPVTGTIASDPAHSGNELIKATAKDTIGLTSVTILGLTVPTSCQTQEALTLPLEASEPLSQLTTKGAAFSGETTIPAFRCSGNAVGNVLGSVVTLLVSGPKNPFTLSIEP